MNREGNPEDLLVLARQCKLEEEEERRFEMAVESSRELEALYNAGVQFDEQASLLPGDETRLRLLVERTLARLDQGESVPPPRASQGKLAAAVRARSSLAVRYSAASLAFAVLFSVALASAWEYAKHRDPLKHSEPAGTTIATHSEPRSAPPMGLPPAPAVDPLPNPSATAAIAERPQRALPTPSSHESKTHTDEALSASQLFGHANELRRQGDIEAAISAYERLCNQYPGSVEAEDAKVLMGNLLLYQRSPRAALQKFEDYGAGALSLEALWGRAQALRKLESPDERAVLEKLVRDYPNSPYRGAAQKRLRELSP